MPDQTLQKARLQRPLSPHLQIYKPIPTMVMSIMHRITGAALYFGLMLLVWWLFALATSESYFSFVNAQFSAWYGRLVLLGFSWALIHHLLGGLKHLMQDTGRGFGKSFTTKMAWLHIMLSLALTLALWLCAYYARQGGF